MQLAYIACLLGRKLTWDPVKEQFPNDEKANRLLARLHGRDGDQGVPVIGDDDHHGVDVRPREQFAEVLVGVATFPPADGNLRRGGRDSPRLGRPGHQDPFVDGRLRVAAGSLLGVVLVDPPLGRFAAKNALGVVVTSAGPVHVANGHDLDVVVNQERGDDDVRSS